MADTKEQFETVIALCRDIYSRKLRDYGASWRIMRPQSITDQILIKAKRIRNIEINKTKLIDEGITPEFIGIVNYCTIALIQLELGFADSADLSYDRALELYDKHIQATKELMYAKNHDYGEAWRLMRVSSYTDLILTKLNRIKEIENNDGQVSVSEGIGANYQDIINYALFGLIKLTQEKEFY
ncbi:MAG: DUF1599 domain-containing protein [Tannerella sp.]|jgi:hypothetical protein|nr:DUF1599 domain-containing protein [Tannerella sp.]